jgi:hypothetical protein
MIHNGFIWFYMVLYGFIWIYDSSQRFMLIDNDYTWIYMDL